MREFQQKICFFQNAVLQKMKIQTKKRFFFRISCVEAFDLLDLHPMKISESIEAHLSTAVAAISQRNQATLPGHLIFISVFKYFIYMAKAFGFCLYFYLEKRHA